MEIFGVSSLLLTNFVSISELTLPSTILVISENQKKGGAKQFPQTPYLLEHFAPPLRMWE
jgi:hypothetical protein